jgi:photosystem II stability/assembly factor-like uncharacterized protein
MPAARHISPKPGDVLLIVGTMKGAFLFRSDAQRKRWQRGGPYFPGQAVYAAAYDDRGGRRRLWAGTENFHFGPGLRASDDFGKTWTDKGNVHFPADAGASLKRVWQIVPGRADEPEVLYCGTEPAALFESRDGGESFSLVRGLWNHPHRAKWQPGGGGLGLHSILPHPADARQMWVAISTGGVYRTVDGGRSWRTAHKGVRAQFLPDPHPEFGQCVHKIARHPSRPERMFLQNHWGLYRTDDSGDRWTDIANGVPSDFGFALAAHPHDADTAYIIPLESDQFRCTPQGKLRVYRTRNAGRSWQAQTRGLPQEDAFETVLRDGMATDTLPKAGIYFGTRSGRVYASSDEGSSWRTVADNLPPVVCVKAAVLGAPAKRKRR